MRLERPVELGELASACGGRLDGPADTAVAGVASLDLAGPDELSFVRSAGDRGNALKSRAGALLVPEDFGGADRPVIYAEDTDIALALMAGLLLEHTFPSPCGGVHGSAIVAEDAELGGCVSVGPLSVIESGARIKTGTRIGALCYIGRGVEIGEDSLLHPNVTALWRTRIGSRVIIHSGAVIGSDGFGFAKTPAGAYRKIAQLGNVVIEDDVEVGACVCIDRATFDSTVIGRGTKLDNLIHIAHNVTVGSDTAMAAQVGIAGSSKVGSKVELGGQSGVVGHVSVGDGCRVGAASPVTRSFPEGLELWGFPARPKAEALKAMAAAGRADELRDEMKKLADRLKALEERPAGSGRKRRRKGRKE